MQILRPYQTEACAAVWEAEEQFYNRVLICKPTGTGKTTTLSEIVKEALSRGWEVLVTAHRSEIVAQLFERIRDHNGLCPITEIGMEIDTVTAPGTAKVICASVQSIIKPERIGSFKQRCKLLIVDEAHHAAADTYKAIATQCGVDVARCFYVGCTATAKRGDKQSLYALMPDGAAVQLKDKKGNELEATADNCVFEKLVFEYPMDEAINDGWIVEPKGHTVKSETDISKVKRTQGDFAQGELAKAVDNATRTLEAIQGWKDAGADNRPTIVFCASVEHAHHSKELFEKAGYTAGVVDGTTDKQVRFRLFEDFRAGRVQVLCNMGVATEGTDLVNCSCIIHLRPTQNWGLYVQMTGRGVRPNCRLENGWSAEERRAAIAASPKQDCVAEGTPVLTDRGLVPIEQITTDMKVWDGVQFSTHCGIICRGIKEVITYAGITATPDHRVWTSEGWETLAWCQATETPIRVTGIGREAVRESDGRFRGGSSDRTSKRRTSARRMQVREEIPEAVRICGLPSERLSRVWKSPQGSPMVGRPLHWGATEMQQPEEWSLLSVRSAGDTFRVHGSDCYGSMDHGKLGAESGCADRPHRQRRELCSRKSAMVYATSEPCSYSEAAENSANTCVPNSSSRNHIRRQRSSEILQGRYELRRNRETIQSAATWAAPTLQGRREVLVFDILNAGPLHRFTAAGLLVSNCIVIDVVDITNGKVLCSVPSILDLPSNMDLQGKGVAEVQKMLKEFEEVKGQVIGECPVTYEELKVRLQAVELLRQSNARNVNEWAATEVGYAFRGVRPGYSVQMQQGDAENWKLIVKGPQGAILMEKEGKAGADFKSYLNSAERHATAAINAHVAAQPQKSRGTLMRLTEKQAKVLIRRHSRQEVDAMPYAKAKALIGQYLTEWRDKQAA